MLTWILYVQNGMHLLEFYMYRIVCTYLSSLCTEWYALAWVIYVQTVMHLLEFYMYRCYALTWVLYVHNGMHLLELYMYKLLCTCLSSICT